MTFSFGISRPCLVMDAAAVGVAAAASLIARLALGVAAFTGEAEALLLLAADPSLFFLGDLTDS